MKAAQIKDYGHVENVEVVEIEKPSPGKGQVLMEVHAASLNPFDTAMREGHARQMADIPLPATLGGDVAGIVSAVGEGVTAFAAGDKVYGQAIALAGNSGAFAEYAATTAGSLALAPAKLTMNESASLPLVGVSALQALTEHMQLVRGQKLFIHGASGGIGTVAIQIAKSLGVYVAASAKGDRVKFVKDLGADEAIDSDVQDFADVLKDYDALLVLARGGDWEKLLSVLKPGGAAVSLVGPADEAVVRAHGVTVHAQMTQTNSVRLETLRGLIDDGVVTPQVAHIYPLDQIREAFSKREGGGVSGKIVIEMKK